MSTRQTAASTDLPGPAHYTGDELPAVERALLVLLAVGGMLVVGYVTMVNSFGHLQEWARLNGESHPRAERFPWSVDGLMLSSSVMLYIDNRLKRPVDKFAVIFLTSGMAMSMLANVANTWHSEIAGYMIRGWAPYAAAATAHMVLLMVTRLFIKTKKVQPAPVEQPKRSRPQTRTQTQTRPEPTAPPKVEAAKSDTGSSQPARPPLGTTATTRPAAAKTAPDSQGHGRAAPPGGSDRAENFLKAQAFWKEEVEAGREPPNGKAIAKRIRVSEGMGRRYCRQLKATMPAGTGNGPSSGPARGSAAEPNAQAEQSNAAEPELSDEPEPAGQPEPADEPEPAPDSEPEPEPDVVPEQVDAAEPAPDSEPEPEPDAVPEPADTAELEPATEPAAA